MLRIHGNSNEDKQLDEAIAENNDSDDKNIPTKVKVKSVITGIYSGCIQSNPSFRLDEKK